MNNKIINGVLISTLLAGAGLSGCKSIHEFKLAKQEISRKKANRSIGEQIRDEIYPQAFSKYGSNHNLTGLGYAGLSTLATLSAGAIGYNTIKKNTARNQSMSDTARN